MSKNKPIFEETYALRFLTLDGTEVGFNPLTQQWGARINEKIISTPDWESLIKRINTAQQRMKTQAAGSDTQKQAFVGPIGGSQAEPIEFHVPMWGIQRKETPSSQDIGTRRIKAYWNPTLNEGAGGLEGVRHTNAQGNWEVHRNWTAVGDEDLGPAERKTLLNNAVLLAIETFHSASVKEMMCAWLVHKTSATKWVRSSQADEAGEILQREDDKASGNGSSHLLPTVLRVWQAPQSKEVDNAELSGWSADGQGGLIRGPLRIGMNTQKQKKFALTVGETILIEGDDFAHVLRLGNVTAVAVEEKVTPLSCWAGISHVSHVSSENTPQTIIERMLRSNIEIEFSQMLVGALVVTPDRNRNAKTQTWILKRHLEKQVIKPQHGKMDEINALMQETLDLTQYVWEKPYYNALYFPITPSDAAFQSLKALSGTIFSANDVSFTEVPWKSLDGATLKRTYERHIAGNPVTAEEATLSSQRLITWLDNAVEENPTLVAIKQRMAGVKAQILAEFEPSIEPRRSPRPR